MAEEVRGRARRFAGLGRIARLELGPAQRPFARAGRRRPSRFCRFRTNCRVEAWAQLTVLRRGGLRAAGAPSSSSDEMPGWGVNSAGEVRTGRFAGRIHAFVTFGRIPRPARPPGRLRCAGPCRRVRLCSCRFRTKCRVGAWTRRAALHQTALQGASVLLPLSDEMPGWDEDPAGGAAPGKVAGGLRVLLDRRKRVGRRVGSIGGVVAADVRMTAFVVFANFGRKARFGRRLAEHSISGPRFASIPGCWRAAAAGP